MWASASTGAKKMADCARGNSREETELLAALLERGASQRHWTAFVKRYEPPGYGYDTVHYEGAVNAEATEIHGRWRIADTGDSGAFLMVRAGRTAQASVSEARSKEPVR